MKPYFKRMLLLAGMLIFVFAAFFVRLDWMIQVRGDSYAERAETRSAKTITLYGMRGTIYDTNMVPLAYDRRSFNVTFYRDPLKNSDADRLAYTQTLVDVIKLVESNGKTTVNDFWLKKDEDGVWRFDSGSDSAAVEQTRENQWRSNFYVASVDEKDLYRTLVQKYRVLDVLGNDADEEMIVKVLALWQESRMNAFKPTPVTIAYDVGYETVSEIEVRSLDLLGVDVEESSSRVYPQGETACHVVGYTSKISATQLETYQNQGYPNDAYIGSDGVERSLEDQLSPYIQYRQGTRAVEVDTRGKAVRELSYTAPMDGNSVVLTIDVDLQNYMAESLESAIKQIHAIQEDSLRWGHWLRENEDILKQYEEDGREIKLAETGAMVAMDPYTGRVLGMVSVPSYDLSMFNDGKVDPTLWDAVLEGNNPLLNRAIGTKDAPGSIFKMCTALGGLSEGVITVDEIINDRAEGFTETNADRPAKCWTSTPEDHQNQNLEKALKNSCNMYFYTVGYRLGIDRLYQWAAALGLTSKTNIELPGEATSFVGNQHMLYDPENSPTWQNTAKPLLTYTAMKTTLEEIIEERKMNVSSEVLEKALNDLMAIAVSYNSKEQWYQPIREILQYDIGLPREYISSHYMVNTFVTYLADIYWTPNETIMCAIGQSITQVTPVAVARYVSAIVNGGTVYDAQIVDKIIAPDGTVVLEKQPVVANQINSDPIYFQTIRAGMEDVTDEVAGGTAAKYFLGNKYKIAAKTGTSQRTELDVENNSWMVAYAPADSPRIVVVCYVQNGYAGAYSAYAIRPVINYYLDSLQYSESYTMPTEFSLAD
ncbi:MAG: hypothetical protein IJ769_02070 [Clostridia bacterium]|nr:hypothetical protein [Clostridia bacterium]